jgi:hypothetical protein
MKPLIIITLLLATFTLTAQKPYYVDANLQKAKKEMAVYQITVTPRNTDFYVVAEDLKKHKVWEGAFKDKDLKVKHGFYTQFANNQRTVETFYKDNLKDGEERFFNEAGKTKQMQFYIKGVNVTPLHFNDPELIIVGNQEKYGLANKYGELVVPIEYDYIGKKEAFKMYTANKKGASKLFDLQGQVQLKTEYDGFNPIQVAEGKWVLTVHKNYLVGIVSLLNEPIIPLEYQDIYYVANLNAFEVNKNNLYGLLSLQNKVLIAPKYDKIVYSKDFKGVDAIQKVVKIKKEEDKVLIYNTKEELLASITDAKANINLYDFGWSSIKYNNVEKEVLLYRKKYYYEDEEETISYQYGVISLDKAVDIPFEFQQISIKHQNLPNMAMKGDKYGYVDLKGKVLIPFQYDDATDFDAETETAYVFIKEQRLKINKKGVVVAKDKKQKLEERMLSDMKRDSEDNNKTQDLQEFALINTIELATTQKPLIYQIYAKPGALQVKYEGNVVANFLGEGIEFGEHAGIFSIYLPKKGKHVLLNPLLKPLLFFEYNYADF